MDLIKLLKPSKFAVVGASEKENLGGFTVRMLLKYAQNRLDDIYFINPGRDTVMGQKCYRSIKDIPDKIDMVIIATPKETVEGLILEAADKGAKGAVVYASGYSETGKEEDKKAEQSLIELCKEKDIALMGPNCAGFINCIDGFPAMGFMTTLRSSGNVGLVSQSGMICTLLMDSGKTDFSYVISCGNSKVVEVIDYIDYLIDDEDTNVIAAYIEGITNPKKFVDTLKKAAIKQKPIVLLKIGRSEEGSRAAASHTGSLSGSDQAFEAIFKKYGVIRVDDLEDLISISNVLGVIKNLPKSNRVVSINGSGGENGVSCDVGNIFEINYPEFSEKTEKEIKQYLPSYASITNPLDTTATICYDTDIFAGALEIILNDDNFDMMLVGITIVNEITDLCVHHMTSGLAKLANENKVKKPILVVPAVESGRMSEYVGLLKEVGIPVLSPCYQAYKQIKKIIDYSEWKNKTNPYLLEDCICETSNQKTYTLSENKSKALLKKYGIPATEEYIAKTEEEAITYAEKIGYPVVLKIESDDILHKSDVGAVQINITDSEEVRKAYRKILFNVDKHYPDANINGVLIQKMLKQGLEVIVGVKNDELFGPMVLFGLGGVFVEIFKDISLKPVPFNKEEAIEMINSLNSSKLINGYRGSNKLDINAIADALVSISNFAVENKNILSEAEINPLFVYEEGVIAADSVVILKD